MTRRNTTDETTTEETNTAAVPATSRPAPKRKFVVKFGDMEAVKRCSVEDMARTLETTMGVSAVLMLDGWAFTMGLPEVPTTD